MTTRPFCTITTAGALIGSKENPIAIMPLKSVQTSCASSRSLHARYEDVRRFENEQVRLAGCKVRADEMDVRKPIRFVLHQVPNGICVDLHRPLFVLGRRLYPVCHDAYLTLAVRPPCRFSVIRLRHCGCLCTWLATSIP